MVKKYKIAVLDGIGMNPGDLSYEKLKSLGDTVFFDNTEYEEIIERAKDSEIVIINKCRFDKNIIDQLPELKYIIESATGYDNIDVEYANQKGILVSNVSGYSTSSVIQHVFALIFALTNKVEYYNREVHRGRWANNDFFTFWDFPIQEIHGKTLGLYGFGNIAQGVAKVALAFGMKVIANRKTPQKGYMRGVEHAEIDDLFRKSDFLSLHAPLTSENSSFVDLQKLKLMKPTAILINTARGKIINENDLSFALDNDIIAGAGLDVLSSEPPNSDNPLLKAKNCVITPHQAWASIESRQRLLDGVINNVKSFIEDNPVNVVN